MVSQAIAFVLDALFHLFILAALVRFWMQAFRASARNPIAQFTMALTDWAVKPLRRVVPGVFNLDWASLIVAFAFEFLLQFLLLLLLLGAAPNLASLSVLLFLAFVKLIRLSIYVFIGAIIIQAVLSWVNPHHPVAPFFHALTRPFLKPFQKAVPLIGGVDITPVLVLIALQLVLMLPVTWLETETARMLQRALL
ncbi:MAG: YggT family protein [Pseudomonadota bacterium]|nr:YggT family protein [Pseudomonadota bacterium]